MIKYSIPCDFSSKTLEILDSLNHQYQHTQIYEVYGNIIPSVFGSGRMDKLLPKLSIKNLKNYIENLNSYKINFNYTLNSYCLGNIETTNSGKQSLYDFIFKLYEIGIRRITISNPYLIDYTNFHFPDIEVICSSIVKVESMMEAIEFKKLGIKRIILSEDIHRNFGLLITLLKYIKLDYELLVNSNCLYNCPFRNYHRLITSHQIQSQSWLNRCKILKIENPTNILISKGWIRPEDINTYYNLGIEYFKIVGRENIKNDITNTLLKTIEVYMKESYDGNLIDLLTNFNRNSFLQKYYISNQNLNNFLSYFIKNPDIEFKCRKGCIDCRYCYYIGKKIIKKNHNYDDSKIELNYNIQKSLQFN